MPDLDWNLATWGKGDYDWKAGAGGEEWSGVWGGSEPQWFGSLYPRLHRFLPSQAILEIAPGFGRWTKFLLPACRNYAGIDLSADCVAACRDVFRNATYARFFQNDGLSLAAVPDGCFSLVFSFDSLVHADRIAIEAYIPQILRKLTPTGVAFLHHSNLAALAPTNEHLHSRDKSVSAETVADVTQHAGGKVLLQERINWGGPLLIDCLSLLATQAFPSLAPPIHIENMRFMEEAIIIRDTHAPYSSICGPTQTSGA